MPENVGPTGLPSGAELLAGLFSVRRGVGLASAGTLLLCCVAALLWTPKYAATASLVMLLGPEYTAQPQAGQTAASTAALGQAQIIKAETEILGSPGLHAAVMRGIGLGRLYPDAVAPPGLLRRVTSAVRDGAAAVLARFGLVDPATPAPDPVLQSLRRFDRHLDVLALKDGNVIEVTFRHPDADIAAAAVNALVDGYLRMRRAIYLDPQAGVVTDQVRVARVRLDAADALLAAFKRRQGIADFATDRGLLLARRDTLRAAADAAEAETVRLAARTAALRAELAHTPPDVPLTTELDSAARTGNVETGLENLQGKLAELLTHFQPDSRPVLDLQSQIAARTMLLDRLRSDHSPSATRSGRNTVYDALDLECAQAASDLAAAQAKAAALGRQLRAIDLRVDALDAQESELARLERDRTAREEDYRTLLRILNERRVVEDLQARSVASARIVQEALPPTEPDHLRLVILAGGTVLSLMAGLAVAVISQATRRSFLTAAQVERELGLPVLGLIPDLPVTDGT
jgi:uncharacterized protein involved in exopolysaccharide biosynthesis